MGGWIGGVRGWVGGWVGEWVGGWVDGWNAGSLCVPSHFYACPHTSLIRQVFGLSRRSFSWLLPSFKAPPGDGMEFPTNPGGALHEV